MHRAVEQFDNIRSIHVKGETSQGKMSTLIYKLFLGLQPSQDLHTFYTNDFLIGNTQAVQLLDSLLAHTPQLVIAASMG